MRGWRLPVDIGNVGYRRWVRQNFPQIGNIVHLNSAGFTPLPAVTLARMRHEFKENYEQMYNGLDVDASLEEFARAGSAFIEAKKEDIAFVTSTTAGISLFANSVKWRLGDNIVLADNEYPSNMLPWIKAIEGRGVKVKTVKSINGLVPIESFEKAVDGRTRVLPVSLVEFASGQRFDLGRLGEICEGHGTMLFLDAIQALGAVKVGARRSGIAGLAAGGYKWLCGPIGSGILYVSSSVIEDLHPTCIHWRSVAKRQQERLWSCVVAGGSLAVDSVTTRKGAPAFESATEETVQMAGLSESLRFLRSIGAARIEERIARLNDHLLDNLDESGFEAITPRARSERAGIVSFRAKRMIGTVQESERIAKELGEVRMAIRGGMFRSSAHFFNTKQDIDFALERLTAICRKRRLL